MNLAILPPKFVTHVYILIPDTQKTNRQTDRQTDRQTNKVIAITLLCKIKYGIDLQYSSI